jgi:ParB family transcriptional regulator, chromosome partitioning protein
MRELDKLLAVHTLSKKFTSLRDPRAAIAWARELGGLSKKVLSPEVVDAVVRKVNQQRITNSKDLRQLRSILKDPVSRDHFLSDEGDIASAALRLMPRQQSGNSLVEQMDELRRSIEGTPYAEIEAFRTDPKAAETLDELASVIVRMRSSMSS